METPLSNPAPAPLEMKHYYLGTVGDWAVLDNPLLQFDLGGSASCHWT